MKACIYENGKIFTSDKENLYGEAMLVEDGFIRGFSEKCLCADDGFRKYRVYWDTSCPGHYRTGVYGICDRL